MIDPLTFSVTGNRVSRPEAGAVPAQYAIELTQTGPADKLKMKAGAVLLFLCEDEDTVKQLIPSGDFTVTLTPVP